MIIEMSKGRQITIPVEIRNEFDLNTGSKFELIKRKNEIILKILGDNLDDLLNNAKNIKPKHKLDAEEMDKLKQAIIEHL